MHRNNTWRLLLVLFVTAWSLFELYPPSGRDLFKVFYEQAEVQDTNLVAILEQAQALQKQNSNQFLNLVAASGTNDLGRYFPNLVDDEAIDRNRSVLHALQKKAAGKIKLGLDLQGGISFLVSLDTNRLSKVSDKKHAQEQAIEVLRKRVDRFGVAEPVIQPEGDNRILIQLPGLSDSEMQSARTQIQKAAFLEFRMVHPESAELVKQGIVEPGYEILTEKQRKKDGAAHEPRVFLVEKQAVKGLGGQHVETANPFPDPMSGALKISVRFKPEGAALFGEATRENVGRLMAIVLDGELYSAPRINEPILGGNCEISGDFDVTEAYQLANVLNNPLETPVHIEQESSLGPSLGRDAIESGVRSAVIGTILVAGFMLVYYMLSGAIANVALIINLIILLGVMSSVHTTLTLPGIAGIVLTVGMAVDANVLIYERIREELAKGKSLRGAVSAGYDRAFGTIFDSHVTTLISSIILIAMGTGPIKGFGVALTIGVAASLFTALVVTRLIFDFLLDRDLVKSLPMLRFIRDTQLDFMRLSKIAFVCSWVFIVIGLGWGIHRGKTAFGVDFRGGDVMVYSFTNKAALNPADVRSALARAGMTDVQIQFPKDFAGGGETLRVTTPPETGTNALQVMQRDFGAAAGLQLGGTDRVGATVGAEIMKSALIAGLLALFGILVYVAFRYEFSFGVGAIVALIHDVLVTIACYFISGREFNATTVAAVLTIIGFSTNDTIVIFDRIREDLKMGVRGSFTELINQAVNQTLSRTIITSGTVLLATLSLYLFGGGAINDFAFTFLVGIITGTYSSIYIASALVLWWHKGQRPQLGAQGVTPQVVAAAPLPAKG